jgi:predicted Ser/Thr protein kinase
MRLRVKNLILVLAVGIQVSATLCGEAFAESKNQEFKLKIEKNETCSDLLSSDSPIAGFDAKFEVHSIRELLSSDPSKNLAAKHPAIVMSAAQKYYAVLESSKYPERRITDPTYPVRKLQLIPIFADAVPEAGHKLIVGQYEAAKEMKSYFRELASGRDAGKGLLFIGPPGTGKTELLYIMDIALDNMTLTDPNFYEYTYRWKHLDQIPDLEPLVANRETGSLFIKPLQRSPITLLPAQLQKRILEVAAPRVQELIGFNPAPMLQPDPQAKEILEHIVRFYQSKEGVSQITEEKYIQWLEKHIDIVRRLPEETQASGVIDYQGKHPTDGQLYVSENVMLSQIFTKNSALSYDYNGQISRRDGRGVFIDELYRNEEGFLNKLLNFIQNGVVQSAGAPALVMDTVVLAATNDENFVEARKRPGAGAAIDRLSKSLMRQTINPTLVAETALHMVSKGKTNKIFKMRALDADVLVPAEITKLFPAPDANGDLQSPDGRYAIYYVQGRGKDILIAPHALEMIGLTVAGTRLVRDPNQVPAQVTKELNDTNVTNSHFFTSVKARLDIITRRVRPESPIYMDLDKLNKLMREGDRGISARDAERWLSKSIEIAVGKGVSVTPIIVSEAFSEMMDKNLFMDLKDQRREDWINILTTVKADFLLPEMTNDVVEVVAGDTGAVSGLYEEIKGEALALSSDSQSDFWYNDTSEKRIINKDRFSEIQKIYREINNEDFVPGKLVTYEAQEARKPSRKPYAPLMRAIQKYLLKSSLNTTAFGRLVDHFDGQQVDHHTQEVARHVEIALTKRGYDRESFRQALRFVYDVEYSLRKRESAR